MSLLSGLNPIKMLTGFSLRTYLEVGAVAVIVAGFLWYRAHLIDTGRQQVRSAVAAAVQKQQATADVGAALYSRGELLNQIESQKQVKKVITHVKVNHSCDLPVSTVRMLNSAIKATSGP